MQPQPAAIPEGFTSYQIDHVEWHDDSVTLGYAGGRRFGGTLRDLLTPEIERLIQVGATVVFRYHTPESGPPGTVAHVLIWDPAEDGWAELYADWQ